MTGLTEFLKEQFDHRAKSDSDWFNQRQTLAFEQFMAQGFPHKKIEAWKYTSVTPLIESSFEPLHPEASLVCQSKGTHIEFQDGSLHLPSVLPQEVVICDIYQALAKYPSLIKAHLMDDDKDKCSAFEHLNIALMQTGLFIHVPDGISLDSPIHIYFNNHSKAYHHHYRHLILMGEYANATVVEHFQGDNEIAYCTNTVTKIVAHKRAHLTHIKVQDEGRSSFHMGMTHIQQDKDSVVNSHSYQLGGRLVRSDTVVDLNQAGAHCNLTGLYATNSSQHVDMHTYINHRHARTTSEEVYKGILQDKSRAVFNGSIKVMPDAQKVDASLNNKNLLLSPYAEVDTKPELEIFADDVKCAHGATVGQLDEKALFYLCSRGISHEIAQELLVYAFAEDVFSSLSLPSVKEALCSRLNEKLRKNHD